MLTWLFSHSQQCVSTISKGAGDCPSIISNGHQKHTLVLSSGGTHSEAEYIQSKGTPAAQNVQMDANCQSDIHPIEQK